MLSREYNRKIQIYTKGFTDDGFGGQIASDNILVKSIWAKIQSNAGTKFVNFGISDFKNPVIFYVRGKKNDIIYDENYHIMYDGVKYLIKGMQDVNLEKMERIIYADSE